MFASHVERLHSAHHVIALNRSARDGLLREGNWNDGLN